jgi:prepilin-type N-terminal cleavage/methylation domain-containing protein
MRNARGLTLLEMLVALSLASTLAGAAAMQYRRTLPTWELKAATRQVVLDLMEARTQAIAEGRAFRLVFSVPGSSYERQYRGDDGDYASSGPPVRLPTHVRIEACTARGEAISFLPRGHAGTFGTLTLRNSDGEVRRIVVDVAGRMRVE